MTDLETLRSQGLQIENQAYFPPGLHIDGAPYTGNEDYLPFIRQVRKLVGGRDVFIQMIRELGGDPNCGNWWLVMALKIVGVPLQTEPRGIHK